MSDFSFAALQEVAKESGFVVLDGGDYEMEVSKSEAKKSKNQKDMIVVTLKVVVGPLAGKGSTITQFVISPDNGKALFFFFKHMKAFGLDEKYFAANPSIQKVAADLMGRRALVTLVAGEYNNNPKNDVTDIKPPSSGPQIAAPGGSGGAGVPNIASPSNGSTSNGTPNITVPPPAKAAPAAEQGEPVGAGASAGAAGMPKPPF